MSLVIFSRLQNTLMAITRGKIVKEKLIEYVMERADREYQDDFPISRIPEWIEEFFSQYQPERSKREDRYIGGYFPPSWNPNDYPEKTEGWIAFQEEQRKDPKYYGCGALNSRETD